MLTTIKTACTLLQVFVLISTPECSPLHPDAKFASVTEKTEKALRFGETNDDHIVWKDVDTTGVTTDFSVCTWLRNRGASYHYGSVVFHYEDRFGLLPDGAVILGGAGYWNEMVGGMNQKEPSFRRYFNILVGKWFHVCWTWSRNLESSLPPTTTVYLNGVRWKNHETNDTAPLPTGGVLYLGSHRWLGRRYREHLGYKYNFGGDMYKLNVYNKALSVSEISKMAADMCSTTEESRLTENRVLKWEDIVRLERRGNVTEFGLPRCLNQTQKILWLVEQRARETGVELREMRSETTQYIINLTIVYSIISTISLILLATLVIKLIYDIRLAKTGL